MTCSSITIRLSPVAYFDEIPTKVPALGAQVAPAFDCYISNEDCGVGWILLQSALDCLHRENGKFTSFNCQLMSQS